MGFSRLIVISKSSETAAPTDLDPRSRASTGPSALAEQLVLFIEFAVETLCPIVRNTRKA